MREVTTIPINPQFDVSHFTPEAVIGSIEEKLIQFPPFVNNSGSILPVNGSHIDYEYLLQSLRINPLDVIEKPPVVISYNGKPLCTLGNISLVIGKPKSRKTFLVTSIAAAARSGCCNIDGLEGNMPQGGVVYYFDTEQSQYHVARTVNRICLQTGQSNPSNFDAFGLRRLTPIQRVGLIQHVIHSLNRPALIIIDGLRDLLSKGINDEADATQIMSKFLTWTGEKNCHILLVLHQNKNDQNARGHIGTEAVNKAETVIAVQKDVNNKAITIVSPGFCRDVDFDSFSFFINENGLPELIATQNLPNSTKINTTRENFIGLLSGSEPMGYNDLASEYSEISGVSMATAKRHISAGVKTHIIIKNSFGLYQLKFQPEKNLEDSI